MDERSTEHSQVTAEVTRGGEKTLLWGLLKSSFLKARDNVRKRGGATFRVRSPEHFALDVLNEHYGKRKSAKIRNYTPEELEHAVVVVRSEGFIHALEQTIIETYASRSGQPVLRETPETAESATGTTTAGPLGPTEHHELQRLRREIERAGGEVLDLKMLGEGLYAFELATPVAYYWGKDTREEILKQVERDVSAAQADRSEGYPPSDD